MHRFFSRLHAIKDNLHAFECMKSACFLSSNTVYCMCRVYITANRDSVKKSLMQISILLPI